MKILITGTCGFVGSTLAVSLLKSGVASEIIGIDNFSRPGSETNRRRLQALGIRVVAGDIRSSSDVELLPKADWLVDAAAIPSVLAGVDGKTSSRQLIEHNLGGTINLLEYCKTHSAGFSLLSTSRVYSIKPLAALNVVAKEGAFTLDNRQDLPLGISAKGASERFSTTPPVSLYGSTKVASELLALEYGSTFDFPVWINRCGVMAGAGQFGHPAQGIFAFWVHSFRERNPLKYIGFNGQGHQVRDCFHPQDLVPLLSQQFAEQIDSDKPRIVNIGGGLANSMSLRQLSQWCAARFEDQQIGVIEETREFDIPWMVLDTDLADKAWNWRPATSLDSILSEIADFAAEHPQRLALSRA